MFGRHKNVVFLTLLQAPKRYKFHVKILLHFYWIIINFLLLIILTGRLFDVQDFRCWLIIHHSFSVGFMIFDGVVACFYIHIFLYFFTNLHKHQTQFNLFNLLLNKITIITIIIRFLS